MKAGGSSISRRALVLGAAAAGVSACLRRGADSLEELAELAAPAAEVGRKYLEQAPDERDRAELRRRLEERFARTGGPPSRARARECIREDFHAGEVVDVDRWQLSLTEARLYALASLR